MGDYLSLFMVFFSFLRLCSYLNLLYIKELVKYLIDLTVEYFACNKWQSIKKGNNY